MEESERSGILVRNTKLPPRRSYKYYPFETGSGSGKEEMKEEVVRLGVEYSLLVSETMFLLCDDIRTVLWFCATLWRCLTSKQTPEIQKLLLVMHHVYSDYIKPKNGVFHDDGNSVRWGLVSKAWKEFTDGVVVLYLLVSVLERNDYSYDDRVLSSAIAQYRSNVLKKLEDKLKDVSVSEAMNGFERERIESKASDIWRSLFDEGEALSKVMRRKILSDMFTPLLDNEIHNGMMALPRISHPYILGKDFAKDLLKEEIVKLGAEMCLFVAESMFLLCDDIRSMLWFCYKLWGDARKDRSPDSPVVERLLCVIHYVYSEHMIPKKGVYRTDGEESVQWRLINGTWKSFETGIRDVDKLVMNLRDREYGLTLKGREYTCRIEHALKKVAEELNPGKHVSEANGFVREAMESRILELWKSIFDKDAKKVVKIEMFGDLFLSVCTEPPPHYLY
ncbi:unnamed protein product [Microthlaspi erraticum]|uniref:Uncharacterized protein n=1 Tax=Microthlaspi erraticum TaxID=1685480 RepID=A0A6D2KBF5_9BRAS|nr:unnamed protein product [Microthlaspi erraticum]